MPQQQELRYRGELLGFHPDEETAEAHAKRHLGVGVREKKDHHVQDEDEVTIEPRRPVSLFCNGSLVDTFHTEQGAHERAEAIVQQSRSGPALDAFDIVRGTVPPPVFDAVASPA